MKSLITRDTAIRILLILIIAIVVVRTAWICDDAYITLRTVDNFVNGHWLVYNIGERVQSYTHPLWMLFLTAGYLVTHEGYYVPIFLSIIVSMAAVGVLMFKIARTRFAMLFCVIAIIFSKAFVDYSTSGLENPLSYLIVVLFMSLFLTADANFKNLFLLALLAALGALNRLDLILVFLPALVFILVEMKAYKTGRYKAILALISGFAPLIAWLLFSLFYYGFAFPNTSYAKLSTGIPRLLLYRNGVDYFVSSFHFDPLTLIVIALGVGVALIAPNKRRLAVAIGVVLYLLYIIQIGGDFMSGRFFAVPFLCALILICTSDIFSNLRAALPAMAIVLLIGIASPFPSIFSDGSYGLPADKVFAEGGVTDERAFYYPTAGLLSDNRESPSPSHPWAIEGRRLQGAGRQVIITKSLGMFGFFAGDESHIVDSYGLTDPLLSRLPIPDPLNWRVGHYERTVPPGYEDTLKSGENQISDPAIAAYYDHLALITRGHLFDVDRLIAIWKMNTHQYDIQSCDSC